MKCYKTKQTFIQAIQYKKDTEKEIKKIFGNIPIGVELLDWIVVLNDTKLKILKPNKFWKLYEVLYD